MAVRIKDVARTAGVSSATVSRVLSNGPNTSEEARRKVLAAVEELNYRPSRVARSLRVQRSRILGLVIPDIRNPFFISLARAIEDVAYEHQHAVFLCNTDEDVEKERLYVDLMQAERVAGVVAAPAQEEDDPCRELVEAGIPMVVVDRRVSDLPVDTVVVDNVGGAFEMVSHLIADGHRRIGAVLGTPAATTGRERHEGYVRALQKNGVPVMPELVRTGAGGRGSTVEEVGYRLTGELLDLAGPPTALFTGSNLLTMGAVRAVYERNLRIPEEVALAGFDEVDWTPATGSGLTVVAQPTYELGRTAAELLLRRIEDGTRPFQEVTLKPTVRIRGSCARHAPEGQVRNKTTNGGSATRT